MKEHKSEHGWKCFCHEKHDVERLAPTSSAALRQDSMDRHRAQVSQSIQPPEGVAHPPKLVYRQACRKE
jgi:hypothetical protein